MKGLGLRVKISAFLLLLTVVAGGFGSYLTYSFVYNTVVKQHSADLKLAVTEETESVRKLMQDAIYFSKLISESYFAEQLLSGKKVDLDYIKAFGASGKYLAVYIMDINGNTLASTDSRLIGQNYGFRDYFKDALIGGTGIETSVGVTTKQLGYYFSSRVLDSNKKAIGVVVVKLDPKVVDEEIANDMSGGLIHMLTDENGVVISTPVEDERLFRSLGVIPEVLKNKIVERKKFANLLGEQLNYQPIMDAVISRKLDVSGYKIYDKEDKEEESFSLTEVLKDRYYLVTEIRWGKVYANARDSSVFVAAVIFGFSLLLGISIVVYTTYILKPITILKAIATRIASGDLKINPVINTGDEFQDLERVFGDLADKLSQSYSGLEEKIKQRTQELEKTQLTLSNQLRVDADKQKMLDEQNQKMTLTQKAIVNLLEDSREYEKELKEQKENVEKLVAKRTKELEEERTKLVASVESLIRGYVLLDLKGKVLLTNRSLREILNIENAPTDLSEISKVLGAEIGLSQMVRQSIDLKKRMFLDSKHFGPKVISLAINPVQNGNELIGVLVMVEDITEKWALERSKDEFFSIASHELRTPLTAIRGNASMIKDNLLPKYDDKELDEMVGDIHEASIRLIGIVNDFLEVSRLEQGRMEYKKEKVSVDENVNMVVNQLKKLSEEKRLSLNLKFETTNLFVMADKQKMIEILINLVGNAIKYTETGEVDILVKKDANKVVFEISDTGRGIPSENQGLLFRKFQQTGNDIKTRDTAKSTGLGLYISKVLAEGMGGKVYLKQSEENKGSTFAFELPLV